MNFPTRDELRSEYEKYRKIRMSNLEQQESDLIRSFLVETAKSLLAATRNGGRVFSYTFDKRPFLTEDEFYTFVDVIDERVDVDVTGNFYDNSVTFTLSVIMSKHK